MKEELIIQATWSIKDTIEYMENNNLKFVFVNEDDRFVGLFTNGDMRKYFLRGGKLNESITAAMNKTPITFSTISEAQNTKKNRKMIVYPIVRDGVLIDALYDGNENDSEESVISNALNEVPLVIMAGGMGTRLYPYTKILPKALIPIGEKPITELIIESFAKYGCSQVYFVLNYKANMIRAYYNELEKNYEVRYVQENKFLGTGGGLSLLKGLFNGTVVVSNCDILLNADFECALRTHQNNKNLITFICAMKDVEISYGVISTNSQGQVIDIKEKPEMEFLTNTGVYLVESRVIEELKDDEFIHFPDIAQRYIDKGEKVGVFPIPDSAWLDMGQISEMEKMIMKVEEN